MSDVLACSSLSKSFHDADRELKILQGIDFSVKAHQSIAILGSSGSGKSTLLHLLGGLDNPSKGEIYWCGQPITQLSEKKKCLFRNRYLGFVYQFHYLLPEFTALENVAMPLLLGHQSVALAKAEAKSFLTKVGLADRMGHKLGELSGGERQRTAIARALISRPTCVLADEPTGNLDQHTADHVLSVMLDLQKELGTSFVIVTHDWALAKKLQVCYELQEGRLNVV